MPITTAHIMVTSLCSRDCKYCCNKQYDLNEIPYITNEELDQMKHIYVTGGEPFAYSNPCEIASLLKSRHKNIESVVVYTNALELAYHLVYEGEIYAINGVTISIKNDADEFAFRNTIVNHPKILRLPSNRLYVFPGHENVECPPQFTKIEREWQKKFIPAPNCIFRKL